LSELRADKGKRRTKHIVELSEHDARIAQVGLQRRHPQNGKSAEHGKRGEHPKFRDTLLYARQLQVGLEVVLRSVPRCRE